MIIVQEEKEYLFTKVYHKCDTKLTKLYKFMMVLEIPIGNTRHYHMIGRDVDRSFTANFSYKQNISSLASRS